jgi:hypothetical protein
MAAVVLSLGSCLGPMATAACTACAIGTTAAAEGGFGPEEWKGSLHKVSTLSTLTLFGWASPGVAAVAAMAVVYDLATDRG